MAEMVDDVQTIVEELKLPERFILVGHSFGGSICVEYANAHRERLEKLVLVATAGEYPMRPLAAFIYRLPTALFLPWWEYRPRWNAEVHVMKRMMLNNLQQWRGWPLLRNIATPTLVITGERDNYFPRHVFEEVGKMVPGAEVYDVGSAKHKVQLERHQAVNRAIERFVKNERQSWRGQHSPVDLAERRPWLLSYAKGTPHTIHSRQPLYKFWKRGGLGAKRVPSSSTVRMTYRNSLYSQSVRPRASGWVVTGDRVMSANTPDDHRLHSALKAGAVVVCRTPTARTGSSTSLERTQAKVAVTCASPNSRELPARTRVEHVVFADLSNMTSPLIYRGLAASGAGGGASADRRPGTSDVRPDGRRIGRLTRHPGLWR
jgi:predicted alpha/beta hydrolase family esterase